MSRMDDRFVRGLKVPLRALWGKAKGGGGRLRQATAGEDKSRKKRTEEEREGERKDAREEAREDAREEAREEARKEAREEAREEGKRRERSKRIR